MLVAQDSIVKWRHLLLKNVHVERVTWLPQGPIDMEIQNNAQMDMSKNEQGQWKRRKGSVLLNIESSEDACDLMVHGLSNDAHLLLKGHKNGKVDVYLVSRQIYFIEEIELVGQIHFNGFYVQANELYYFQMPYGLSSVIDSESEGTIVHQVTPYPVVAFCVGDKHVGLHLPNRSTIQLLPRLQFRRIQPFEETGDSKCILEDGFAAYDLLSQMPVVVDAGDVTVEWNDLVVSEDTLLRLNDMTKGLREQVSVLLKIKASIEERSHQQRSIATNQAKCLHEAYDRLDDLDALDAHLCDKAAYVEKQNHQIENKLEKVLAMQAYCDGQEADKTLLKKATTILNKTKSHKQVSQDQMTHK